MERCEDYGQLLVDTASPHYAVTLPRFDVMVRDACFRRGVLCDTQMIRDAFAREQRAGRLVVDAEGVRRCPDKTGARSLLTVRIR
jgi:hypothetical protein